MNLKRVGPLALLGCALLLIAVEPAAAQSTSSSTTESLIWDLNNKLLYAAIPITVLVEGILIYTVWKYRKSDEAQPTQENRRLEITWTIATAVILLFVGVASYQVLGNPYITASASDDVQDPATMEEIEVYAQAYNFEFVYDDVDVEGVSAEGVSLSNVSVENARVANVSDEGVVLEGGDLSGEKIEGGTLESGTATNVDRDVSEGEEVSLQDVTLSGATVSDVSASGVRVSNTDTMVMPADRDVRLNITSRDLLHAVHVPGLGLKQDAVPGESNFIQTRATETGEYQLYCAEYCGVGHSGMLGTVEVVDREEYEEWLGQQWLQSR